MSQQTLNQEQIDNARKQVDELHPLQSVPLGLALPMLSLFTGKQKGHSNVLDEEVKNLPQSDQLRIDTEKSNFNSTGSKNKKKQKDNKRKQLSMLGGGKGAPVSEVRVEEQIWDENEDPINVLGYGLCSYFDMIKNLVKIFVVLTILNIPLMYLFSHYDAYKSDKLGVISQFTIGNMGMARTQCDSAKLAGDAILMSCNTGVIDSISYIGINQPDENMAICMPQSDSECSSVSKNSNLRNFVSKGCLGKESCLVNGVKKQLTMGKQASQSGCNLTNSSVLYAQYTCKIGAEELNEKKHEVAMASIIAIQSTLIFLIGVYYIRSTTMINKIEWDLQTITASDYTVEMSLSLIQVDALRNLVNTESFRPNEVMGFRLKLRLKQEIEKLLRESSNNNQDHENFNQNQLRIADINFVFDNSEVIEILKVRGTCIKTSNWDKLAIMEARLEEVMQRDMYKLTIPIQAFITMENEDGYKMMESSDTMTILDDTSTITQATEPTNIVWENRQYSYLNRLVRATVVIIIIGLVLAIVFVFIFLVKIKIKSLSQKYQKANCKQMGMVYDEPGLMQNLSIEAWFDYYKPSGKQPAQISSVLSCFCEKQSALHGYSVKDELFTNSQGQSAKICLDYLNDKNYIFVVGQSLALSINVVNFILKTITVQLSYSLKLDTYAAQTYAIMIGVFVAQFFNTGMMLTLVNANFDDHVDSNSLNSWFSGQFTDFNEGWYQIVGVTLIKTMMISALMPPMEFCGFYGMRFVKRILDRAFSSDIYQTKKTNNQQYIDLYSGPDYLIHFRYSTLLLHSSICLIYGTACPSLYLIALVAFVILHINERLAICYSYRQPAAIDDRLTKSCLNIMQSIPVVSLMFVWWQLGNRQLLENALYPIQYATDARLSGHTISQAIDNFDVYSWNSAPFVLSCILVFLWVASIVFPFFFKWMIDTNHMDLDEGLSDYFSALEVSERNDMCNTEKYFRDKFQLKTFDELTYDKLQNQPQAWNTIEGVPSYSIMDNHLYMMQFQFVPTFIPNRELMIVDGDDEEGNDSMQSDKVYLALNCAYIPPIVKRQVKFAF